MRLSVFFYVLIIILWLPLSCDKTGGTLPPPPPDPCSLINMSLNGSVTNPSVPGASNGTITVSATGGSGFIFSLNGGGFQTSDKFYNLPAGNYTVIVKNADGCSASIHFQLSDPTISCTGVTIMVSPVVTGNVLCETVSASITVSVSGGVAPYSYSLNGGVFQSANTFDNLPNGSYIILVKDANGCTGTSSTTITNAPAGPLFTQVRTLVRNNCLYCHGGNISSGGVNYSDDCNIVTNRERIKARAVDGNPSPMPATGLLPASERQKIIDWINAGGRYSD